MFNLESLAHTRASTIFYNHITFCSLYGLCISKLDKSEFRSHMNSDMFCKVVLSCVRFAALVAREMLFPGVRHHVALQVTGRS